MRPGAQIDRAEAEPGDRPDGLFHRQIVEPPGVAGDQHHPLFSRRRGAANATSPADYMTGRRRGLPASFGGERAQGPRTSTRSVTPSSGAATATSSGSATRRRSPARRAARRRASCVRASSSCASATPGMRRRSRRGGDRACQDALSEIECSARDRRAARFGLVHPVVKGGERLWPVPHQRLACRAEQKLGADAVEQRELALERARIRGEGRRGRLGFRALDGVRRGGDDDFLASAERAAAANHDAQTGGQQELGQGARQSHRTGSFSGGRRA